jgi:hypothetical protein
MEQTYKPSDIQHGQVQCVVSHIIGKKNFSRIIKNFFECIMENNLALS